MTCFDVRILIFDVSYIDLVLRQKRPIPNLYSKYFVDACTFDGVDELVINCLLKLFIF